MNETTQLLQTTLEKFGFIVLNRFEPIEDIPCVIDVQMDDGNEEWYRMTIIERATIKDWADQCYDPAITLASLGPYFYKVVAE